MRIREFEFDSRIPVRFAISRFRIGFANSPEFEFAFLNSARISNLTPHVKRHDVHGGGQRGILAWGANRRRPFSGGCPIGNAGPEGRRERGGTGAATL